jgi:hypothetical protein
MDENTEPPDFSGMMAGFLLWRSISCWMSLFGHGKTTFRRMKFFEAEHHLQ